MQPDPIIDERLRVVTYNLHSCVDRRRGLCHAKTLQAVRGLNPDVAAFQEVDVGIPRTGGIDQIRYLAENLGMQFVFCPAVPHGPGRYGIGVLSRFPLETVRCELLPMLRPFRFERRCALHVRVRTAAGRVSLINTHLGLFAPERRIQAAALTGERWLGAVAPNEPVVMCGDLNAGPRSPVYRRLAALLQDVQRADDFRQSARPTFSSRRPRFRLDHIFVSDHFRILGVSVPQAQLFREISDHLPLCTDLALDRSAPNRERSR